MQKDSFPKHINNGLNTMPQAFHYVLYGKCKSSLFWTSKLTGNIGPMNTKNIFWAMQGIYGLHFAIEKRTSLLRIWIRKKKRLIILCALFLDLYENALNWWVWITVGWKIFTKTLVCPLLSFKESVKTNEYQEKRDLEKNSHVISTNTKVIV